MFTAKVGYELKTVKRRERDVDTANAALSVSVREAEPFLEGVEINGRFVVIYSKTRAVAQHQITISWIVERIVVIIPNVDNVGIGDKSRGSSIG